MVSKKWVNSGVDYHNIWLGENPSFVLTTGNIDSNKVILLIEDNPTSVRLFTDFLSSRPQLRNYKIIGVRNGTTGIAKAIELLPEIIICDVMMPQPDGFKVCKSLKQVAVTKKIPFIFLSALHSEEAIHRGLSLGAVNYIFKPINPKELTQVIDSTFQGIRLGIYEEDE